MKKYLTVLLAAIALPVFGAGGGWTLLGSPLSKTLGNGTGIICGEIPSYSSGWGENMDVYTNCLYTDANTLPNGYVELWWTVVTNCPTIQHNPIDMIYTTYWSPLDSPGLWTALASVTNNFIETNWLSSRVASDYTWLTNGYYTVVALETNYVSGANANWVYTTNCIGCATVNTNPGALVWETNSTKTDNLNDQLLPKAIASDTNGNSFEVGMIYSLGTIYIGTNAFTTLSTNGLLNYGYIIKRSSSGSVVWVATMTSLSGSSDITVNAVKCDPQGNIFVSGSFTANVDFSGTVLTSVRQAFQYSANTFVAKYNTNGSLVWIKQFASQYGDVSHGLSVDSQGNVIVDSDYSWPSLDIGSGYVFPNVGSQINSAVIKMQGSNGNIIWTNAIQVANSRIYSVAVDKDDNVIVAGNWSGGNVAKFSGATGVRLWQATDFASVACMTVDPVTGNIFTGGTSGTGGKTAYISCISSNGILAWSLQDGNAPEPTSPVGSGTYGMAIDSSSNFVFTGTSPHGVYFGGPTVLTGMGTFIVGMSLSGTNAATWKWGKQYGYQLGQSTSGGIGVAFDSLGRSLCMGSWTWYVDFGNGPIYGGNGGDSMDYVSAYRQ